MTETLRSRLPLRTRLPASRRALAVLAGDLLVLGAFIATGQYSHGYLFWEAPVRTLLIVLPFAACWLALSSLAGLFDRQTLRSYRRTLALVVPAWVGTALAGGALRATPWLPGRAPLTFLLVTVAFGLLFVGSWRLVATWFLARTR